MRAGRNYDSRILHVFLDRSAHYRAFQRHHGVFCWLAHQGHLLKRDRVWDMDNFIAAERLIFFIGDAALYDRPVSPVELRHGGLVR